MSPHRSRLCRARTEDRSCWLVTMRLTSTAMDPSEYANIAQMERVHWWYRGLRNIVLKTGSRTFDKSSRILDVGCGAGGMMRELHSQWPAATLIGLDLSFSAVTFSQDAGLVIQADSNTLPLASNSVDVVISLDMLCHQSVDENKALKDMLRVLKPAGTAILQVPAFEWLRSYHDRFVQTARRYTTSRVRAVATDAGFGVSECFYRNSFLFPLMVAERCLSGIFRKNMDRSAVVQHSALTNGIFETVLALEADLLSRGLRFPAGGSVFAVLRKPDLE